MSEPKLEPCPFCGGDARCFTRMSERYQRQYHNVGCDLDECPGHWANFLSTDDKEKAVARWNNQWHKGRNDFLQGQIKEAHQIIDTLRDEKQRNSECAAELLNAIKAYDAAYKRADELRYMLEQIVNFRSKTPEDRDDLLAEARKLLEA